MKRKSLWQRGDDFAARNVSSAHNFKNTPTGLWEFLRFSYMAGWVACERHRRYQADRASK